MKGLVAVVVFMLAVLQLSRFVGCYRPVIVMHGILDDAESLDQLVSFIKTAHPGTTVHNINAFNEMDSFENMWHQVHGVQEIVAPVFANATDGVNLICYSQGGLICRGFLEAYPDHNVKSFISLSSPQAGQFGDTVYLHFFPPNMTRDEVYRVCYNKAGQDFSICNYWNDPRQQALYEKYSEFLYPLNSGSDADYKINFLTVEELILIGGPDDGVITPWQSSRFGFYDDKLVVQPYQSQGFYASDAFGLKTLDSQGRIHVYEVAGVEHTQWHRNKTVFDTCIEPWLK